MNDWNDQVVILRLGHFHEADIWLRVLSRKFGLLTLFAFGGARSIHRFCGCLDLFNTLECRIKPSRTGAYLNLEEASLLAGVPRLRKDWRRMGIAANCLRFLELAVISEEEAEKAFLLLESLKAVLEQAEPVPSAFPLFFRLAIATITGFAPDLRFCGNCGHPMDMEGYFLLDEGKILCPACARNFNAWNSGQFLSSEAVRILGFVQNNLPESWPQTELALRDKSDCARLINNFIERHMGIEFGDGGFKVSENLKRPLKANS